MINNFLVIRDWQQQQQQQHLFKHDKKFSIRISVFLQIDVLSYYEI